MTNRKIVIMLKSMQVPIKWLKEFIPCDKSAQELADLFILKGIEVKNITRVGKSLEGYVVAKIKAINKNSLIVTDSVKEYTFDAVTYHLKVNDKIGFNPDNLNCLNPVSIKLSEDTLPYILEPEYETGKRVLDYLDDHVIELEILPNRGDLMSIIGLARELASYEEIEQSLQNANRQLVPVSDKYNINDLLTLQVLEKDACPDYIARLICDVVISPSPFWLQWRLLAVGLRPINNVVDATNYLMVKYGTPLHAFDYDKVMDKTIQVRFAKKDEKIRLIDNNLYKLNEKVLVIADKKFPIALAGIMGGFDSEISFNTRRILLECARFDAKSVRKSSKSINLSTEASQRFEMGIDCEILDKASDETCNLIAQISNGKIAQGKLEVRTPVSPVSINLSYAKTNRLLGIKLLNNQIVKILSKLNCPLQVKDESVTVTVPCYRMDWQRDVDLIEEIARIYGYDKIPSCFSLRGSKSGKADDLSKALSDIRKFFTGLGFIETYTISFCAESAAQQFTEKQIIKIPNPLNERYSALRPSILATLLDCVRINLSRGNKNLRVFEIGKIFDISQEPIETINLTALLVGESQPLFWQNNKTPLYDYFDIKAVTELFFDYLKIKDMHYYESIFKYGGKNCVEIKYADKTIGYLGEIKQTVLESFDILTDVYMMNLDLKELLRLAPRYRYYQALPRFPSVVRDFALVIDDKPSVQELKESIEKIAGALLHNIEIFDYFQGKPLPEGKRNLGIRITLQSEERTLNQTEVNKIFDKILSVLKERLNVQIRL